MLPVLELLLTVVAGVDERELLLTAPLRDVDVEALLLLRVIVVEELVPEETAPLRVVRVVVELPLSVLSARPVVLFVVPTDERVERLAFVFDTALLVELRDEASFLNDVLRPVVVVVALRDEVEALRDDATAELRLLTADEEV